MTSYVTREEYDRLAARMEALEGKGATVNVTVQGANGDERVRELVREGMASAMKSWRLDHDRDLGLRR